MASNGYVRAQCSRCVFYRTERELGHECTVYSEEWGEPINRMRWVSAIDYDRDSEMRARHDEECEHFFSKSGMRSIVRNVLEVIISE